MALVKFACPKCGKEIQAPERANVVCSCGRKMKKEAITDGKFNRASATIIR
jgi:hypothetical protein